MPKIIENVQEVIITEAKAILINGDYESFNIRDLSKKCNISVGTIYNYFPNKYELVHSVFINDWNITLDSIEDISYKEIPFCEKLEATYMEISKFLDKYRDIFIQITVNPKYHKQPPKHVLESLYPLINKMVDVERRQGNLRSQLPNEKLNKFIVNNFMLICTDKTLTFDEIYSLMNL